MRIQVTMGSAEPRRSGLAVPLIKLGLVGLAALVIVNRKDIRRYLRLRRM